MNKVISIIIMSCFFLNSLNAQPLRYEEDELHNDSRAITWEPAPINITVGDLELKTWLLYRLVPAPEPGYLINKSDWIEIRRMLDSLDEEIIRVKKVERASCDESLKEKDIFCKNLNADLIKEIDTYKIDITENKLEIKSLKKENFWTKIISGTIIISLSSVAVYQSIK